MLKLTIKTPVYQKMLANLVGWLRRSFNWNRLKCPEILDKVGG